MLGSDYVPESPSILIYSQYLLSAYHVQGTVVLRAMYIMSLILTKSLRRGNSFLIQLIIKARWKGFIIILVLFLSGQPEVSGKFDKSQVQTSYDISFLFSILLVFAQYVIICYLYNLWYCANLENVSYYLAWSSSDQFLFK